MRLESKSRSAGAESRNLFLIDFSAAVEMTRSGWGIDDFGGTGEEYTGWKPVARGDTGLTGAAG